MVLDLQNVDIISDSDDAVAHMITQMKEVAEVPVIFTLGYFYNFNLLFHFEIPISPSYCYFSSFTCSLFLFIYSGR